jgi:hypothetical protein
MVCPTRIRACEAYTHNSTHIHECTQISLSLSRSLSLSLSLSYARSSLTPNGRAVQDGGLREQEEAQPQQT